MPKIDELSPLSYETARMLAAMGICIEADYGNKDADWLAFDVRWSSLHTLKDFDSWVIDDGYAYRLRRAKDR